MTKSRGILRPKWRPTPEQTAVVAQRYPTTRSADLAAELGVTTHQITRLAYKLGVRKCEQWLNSPAAQRLDGIKGMGTRFQPGGPSWIKGKKLPGHGAPDTWFKPGQRPMTWRPIGTYRLAGCGYLQVKVADTGYPPRDWTMVHRVVWEQAHGPIPPGHIVAFKDGRKRTELAEITPDVLECIPKAEHLRRHSIHAHGVELARVSQLRGALTRQINRRERAKDTTE